LSEATGDPSYAGRALDVVLDLQRHGVLSPRDQRMIDDVKRRAGR
jgi:hypothetical protein